ncbi:MAG: M48 family metallopeptidase [Vicinamibacterales bacterium]
MSKPAHRRPSAVLVAAAALAAVTALVSAQTKVTAPKNKFPVTEDVKLGKEAAAEVRRTMPLLSDEKVAAYVSAVGARLVAAVPTQYRTPEFTYTFEVVNQAEINAFALPGGPMFLNRGMIEKAGSEGGVVGVMAHEIVHVLLRHGTAQVTKAQRFQIGAIAGQILGAVVGGTAGSIIAQGSEFGLGTYFMKFSREYEKQADLLGAQIMARAGWDPREMAEVFKAIEKEGGSGGPQWLSSHPNPGNRYEYILKEAKALTVAPGRPATDYQAVRTRLSGMPPAYTAEQVAKMQKEGGPKNTSTPPAGTRTVKVAAPDSRTKAFTVDGVKLSVPSNWLRRSDLGSPTFAPEGAVVTMGSGTAFTHGVQFGTTKASSPALDRETAAFIKALTGSNPQIRWSGRSSATTLAGRQALSSTLSNVSEVTGGPETLTLVTALTADGQLFYLIGVFPEAEMAVYAAPIDKVRQSLQLPR